MKIRLAISHYHLRNQLEAFADRLLRLGYPVYIDRFALQVDAGRDTTPDLTRFWAQLRNASEMVLEDNDFAYIDHEHENHIVWSNKTPKTRMQHELNREMILLVEKVLGVPCGAWNAMYVNGERPCLHGPQIEDLRESLRVHPARVLIANTYPRASFAENPMQFIARYIIADHMLESFENAENSRIEHALVSMRIKRKIRISDTASREEVLDDESLTQMAKALEATGRDVLWWMNGSNLEARFQEAQQAAPAFLAGLNP